MTYFGMVNIGVNMTYFGMLGKHDIFWNVR